MSQDTKVTISCGENYDEYETPNPEKESFTDKKNANLKFDLVIFTVNSKTFL